MREIVSSKDLRLGMFVAELDRPWLGTPFPLEGVLLEEAGQIDALRKLCCFVAVDRTRSVGHEYAARPESPPVAPRPATRFVRAEASANSADRVPRFIQILRALRQGKGAAELLAAKPEEEKAGGAGLSLYIYQGAPEEQAARADPALFLYGDKRRELYPAGRTYADRVSVEDEIVVSHDAYVDTQELVRDLAEQMADDRLPSLDRIGEAVDGMVGSIVRNPDALIWLSKLKRTDNYSYDHALDVSVHLMAFGRHLGMPTSELHMLGVAGLLQDLGKLRLPPEILRKAGPLSRAERLWVKQHVNYSTEMLASHDDIPKQVAEIVSRHHERADGSGYPLGLKGEQIGLFGEMAGLVDCYCAMSKERSFRPPIDSQQALEEINSMRGLGFSEAVVDEFSQCMGLYPVGALVELSSGEVAVIVAQNRVRRLKPRLLVLLGPDKTPNRSLGMLDLLSEPMVSEGVPYKIVRALPPGAYGIDPREFYL